MNDAIFMNKKGYKVYAVGVKDVASTRVSVECYVKSPKGEMSEIFSVRRRDLVTGKNTLDFFLDLDGEFDNAEVDSLSSIFQDMVDKDGKMTIQSKASPTDIHHAVSRYIREEAEKLKDNPKTNIFIRGKYGYMETCFMDQMVLANRDLGVKRKDILKILKIMGVLVTGKNRPYDNIVTVSGEKKRVYKIELAKKDDSDDKVCEVIAV